MTRAGYETHASLAVNVRCDVRREEYLNYMTFRSNEHPLFTELFGPLAGLKDEWLEQGAAPEELDLSVFRYRAPMRAAIPVSTGWLGGAEEMVLEETDEYVITLDRMGRRMKLIKGCATIPLPLDYPVRNMDDWLAIKHHYDFSEERFGSNWEQIARRQLESGCATLVSIPGGFDEPRQLMGEENACLAFYDQPELIHDILSTIGSTAFKVL
ncbi:MAG: hypothetical protein ACPL7K_09955, partial [Armatimonadota bacterium]